MFSFQTNIYKKHTFVLLKFRHQMRNLLILLFLPLFFTNCDSTDTEVTSSNTIVGTWTLVKRTIDGSIDNLGECESVNTYTYNANGTFEETLYAAVVGSPCLSNPTVVNTGTWTKTFDGFFQFTNSNGDVFFRDITFNNFTEFYFEYCQSGTCDNQNPTIIRETYQLTGN